MHSTQRKFTITYDKQHQSRMELSKHNVLQLNTVNTVPRDDKNLIICVQMSALEDIFSTA